MSTARSSQLEIKAIAALSAFTKYALVRISREYFCPSVFLESSDRTSEVESTFKVCEIR